MDVSPPARPTPSVPNSRPPWLSPPPARANTACRGWPAPRRRRGCSRACCADRTTARSRRLRTGGTAPPCAVGHGWRLRSLSDSDPAEEDPRVPAAWRRILRVVVSQHFATSLHCWARRRPRGAGPRTGEGGNTARDETLRVKGGAKPRHRTAWSDGAWRWQIYRSDQAVEARSAFSPVGQFLPQDFSGVPCRRATR
jgi:hypothetical protein